jgi:trehalose 6-phosphate synthase/phosphatase
MSLFRYYRIIARLSSWDRCILTEALSHIVEHALGRPRVLFLDYDGTLVPFAEKPHLAHPDSELLELLEALAAREDTAVHIVTGRTRGSIEAWLGHLAIGLHAEHGYWTRPIGASWTARSARPREWQAQARVLMSASVVAVPGSLLEEKESCMAWHFRLVEPCMAMLGCDLLRGLLQPLLRQHDLELLSGSNVLELRQRGVHKGHVVRELVRDAGDDAFIVAVGDDLTDDDMFMALPARGFAIAASVRPSTAHARISGPESVRAFLRHLCETPSSMTRLCAPIEPV